jgi:hypothetical protein
MDINDNIDFNEVIIDIIRGNNTGHFHFKESVFISIQNSLLRKKTNSNIIVQDEIYLEYQVYKVIKIINNTDCILSLMK